MHNALYICRVTATVAVTVPVHHFQKARSRRGDGLKLLRRRSQWGAGCLHVRGDKLRVLHIQRTCFNGAAVGDTNSQWRYLDEASSP